MVSNSCICTALWFILLNLLTKDESFQSMPCLYTPPTNLLTRAFVFKTNFHVLETNNCKHFKDFDIVLFSVKNENTIGSYKIPLLFLFVQ